MDFSGVVKKKWGRGKKKGGRGGSSLLLLLTESELFLSVLLEVCGLRDGMVLARFPPSLFSQALRWTNRMEEEGSITVSEWGPGGGRRGACISQQMAPSNKFQQDLIGFRYIFSQS